MIAKEGDSVTFFTTTLQLPAWKYWLGYRYLYIRLVSNDSQIKYLGFIAEDKNYLNRESFGYIRDIQHTDRSFSVKYYSKPTRQIHYRLSAEQAKLLNIAYESRDIGFVDTDEDWLYNIFPELDRDMNGPTFYEQLLDLRV